ncbi:MAG: hypothetical protein H6915_09530 [Novosphingobium sp.]|nr:hypothetical protein [Novosphingobium sp.]
MNPIDSSMAELEAEIFTLAGHPFDLGSAQELSEALFDRLSLPGGERLPPVRSSTPFRHLPLPSLRNFLAALGFRALGLILEAVSR